MNPKWLDGRPNHSRGECTCHRDGIRFTGDNRVRHRFKHEPPLMTPIRCAVVCISRFNKTFKEKCAGKCCATCPMGSTLRLDEEKTPSILCWTEEK